MPQPDVTANTPFVISIKNHIGSNYVSNKKTND